MFFFIQARKQKNNFNTRANQQNSIPLKQNDFVETMQMFYLFFIYFTFILPG